MEQRSQVGPIHFTAVCDHIMGLMMGCFEFLKGVVQNSVIVVAENAFIIFGIVLFHTCRANGVTEVHA